MKISPHPQFIKAFRKRIAPKPKLVSKVLQRIKLFQQNINDPILRSHKLTGAKKELFSFSISGDIRIIYRVEVIDGEETVVFLDIGSHNQVY